MTQAENDELPNMNGMDAPEIVAKKGAAKSPVNGRELLRGDAGSVQASTVTMDRSGAETISAERVSMAQSGTRTLEAKSAQLENSGVVVLKSDNASLYKSPVGVATANILRLSKSNAVVAVSGSTEVHGDFRAGLHAGPVSGDITVVIDGKRLVLLGAVIAVCLKLLGSVLSRANQSGNEG